MENIVTNGIYNYAIFFIYGKYNEIIWINS
jgi:hypothetical protein